jgi:Na+/melibiose symporter-like transporter
LPYTEIKTISVYTERLSLGTKLTFGSGAMAEAVYSGMFNTFITIYYNQVVGLSNTLIGVAIMLAMIGDAITDPVVGIMSDRWRTGTRTPGCGRLQPTCVHGVRADHCRDLVLCGGYLQAHSTSIPGIS